MYLMHWNDILKKNYKLSKLDLDPKKLSWKNILEKCKNSKSGNLWNGGGEEYNNCLNQSILFHFNNS